MSDLGDSLHWAADQIAAYRASLADRPVAPTVHAEQLRAGLDGLLPDEGIPAQQVIEQLAAAVEPGLVATAGPRFFGFVVGGALESATCADILAAGWDQVAFNPTTSLAGAVAEDVAGDWLKEVFGLPAGASFGLVTGGQGANNVALAAARHRVLEQAGWDVEQNGLSGAPRIRIVAGEERHATIDRALRLLGLGAAAIEPVPADANGAIDPEALDQILAAGPKSPTIVCLQAGNVNTGACDDLAAGCRAARRYGAWVHVDGAFGLWAAASPATRHLVNGIELADSWAVDGHKWLNVPYDCGYVFCAHPQAHLASMSYTAAYLTGHGEGTHRAPSDFVPESSRRARGFATWAALKELGRQGLCDLVDRCCAHARRFGDRLGSIEGVQIGNDIVLNQVLVSFGTDERTDRVITGVQRDGTCWAGGTTWHGRRYLRISVSNWSTTEADVDLSVTAIRKVLSNTA
ncbi:MAG TPA: aminotransferase class V-fold PLP-dependent enzyme [Actinomycetota bacterium]|nr:aminotransferase class V-fold PLP-dependent enzyme [Actinomycetota bacterium]